MSKRNDRREAQRQARKLALQQRRQPSQLSVASNSLPPVTEPFESNQTESQETGLFTLVSADLGVTETSLAWLESEPIAAAARPAQTQTSNSHTSEARRQANRANAKLSTGPLTAQGKRKSSTNALKHALTGKAVLLPTDDAGEYQRQLDMRLRAFEPATEEEGELVQSIVDCAWRLNRIKEIETGILLKGQLEFAEKHADQPAARRLQLINSETFLKYEKSIRNLNIQEARLLRRMEKDQAKLLTVQAARKREQEKQNKDKRQVENAACNGFEFSSAAQPSQKAKIAAKAGSSYPLNHASGAAYSSIQPNCLS